MVLIDFNSQVLCKCTDKPLMQMAFNILLILIVFNFAIAEENINSSDPILRACNNSSNQNCYTNNFGLPLNISNGALLNLHKWSWINDKLKHRELLLKEEKNAKLSMLRFLRDDYIAEDESREWFSSQKNQLNDDIKALKQIVFQLNRYRKRLNMCFNSCSPSMKIENEEMFNYFQTMKLQLLIKNPLLAHPDIEQLLVDSANKEEVELDSEKVNEVLIQSHVDYLSTIVNEQKRINDITSDINGQYQFLSKTEHASKQEIRQSKFLEMVDERLADNDLIAKALANIDWETSVNNPLEKDIACDLYKKRIEYLESEETKEIVFDTTMFVLPFVVGPAFRLGAWSARSIGLLKWGMKEEILFNLTKFTSGAVSSLYMAKDLKALSEKSDECKALMQEFVLTKNSSFYAQYNQCREELSNNSIISMVELGLVSFPLVKGTLNSLKHARSFQTDQQLYLVRNFDELKDYITIKNVTDLNYGESGFKLAMQEKDYYILNLGSTTKELDQLSNNYWQFVGDTYAKRLDLSADEIKSFIKSSQTMAPRTTLVVETTKNNTNEFVGGVGIVSSNNKSDLLPFEKATGIKVDRPKGEKIIEIVRLTVNEDIKDKNVTKELLAPIFESMTANPEITYAYVYTSKKHKRLYERLLKQQGIKYEVTNELERDVVMKIELRD